MAKRKKLSSREKVINRVQRRLKTLEKNGVAIKINPTKENIKAILEDPTNKQAIGRITKDKITQVTNEIVDKTTYHISDTRKVKKILNKKTVADVRALTGQELHDIISDLYDNNNDQDADDILEAYGY